MTTYSYSDELFSDLHKDAYGCRPQSGHIFYTSGADEKQYMWDQAVEVLEDTENARMLDELRAIVKFEKNVKALLAGGAVSRSVAISCIFDGVDTSDRDYLCYNVGVPYGYLNNEEML